MQVGLKIVRWARRIWSFQCCCYGFRVEKIMGICIVGIHGEIR